MTGSIHLIAGSTGAGKTTYALDLARNEGGMRFSIDEWMTTLFWMDSPQPIEFEWTMARISRCETQILSQVGALSALGIASVLDLGFTRADHRTKFINAADDLGVRATLHWLDIPTEERWLRVQQRNAEKGETFAMNVDRDMFDFMEGQWQPPSADELERCEARIVR